MSNRDVRRCVSLAVAFLVALLIPPAPSIGGQRLQRLMSTPAERLVGHWIEEDGLQSYYSPIGENGVGNHVDVEVGLSGTVHRDQYRVKSQDRAGEHMIVEYRAQQSSKWLAMKMVVSKDGKTMKETIGPFYWSNGLRFKYLDDQVEPGAA